MKIGIKNKDNPVPSIETLKIIKYKLLHNEKLTDDEYQICNNIIVKEINKVKNGVETNNEQPN